MLDQINPSDPIEEEEWRPIKDFEGVYSVSNLGRVRREITGPNSRAGRISIGSIDNRGYRVFDLRRLPPRIKVQIHTLVLYAFIGAPAKDGKDWTGNHKDGDKLNNRASNLEWLTRADNLRHAFDSGLNTALKSWHKERRPHE